MLKTFLNDLIKIDTLLAFTIATILQYINNKNMLESLFFAINLHFIFIVFKYIKVIKYK